MRVGIFFSLNSYGGVQTCVISLVKGLNRLDIIPDLLSDEMLSEKIVDEHNLRLNLVPIKFSISRSLKNRINNVFQGGIDLLYYFKTSKLKVNYDFVYIFQPNIIVNTKIPFMYYLSMSPRAPGYSGRQMLPKIKFFVYDYFIKYFIPVYELHGSIDNYAINSEYTAGFFLQNYKKKVKVVYPSNLIALPKSKDYDSKNTVLFLSRVDPLKRPELFLELCSHFPELQFELIGASEDAGYIENLKQMIERRKIINVQLFIDLPYKEILVHLDKAKFYVFTAKNEHFGITTVEAMMYGAIPYVHNSGGQMEIVPWEELRFEDGDFIKKFQQILKFDQQKMNELRNSIFSHIEKFSEKIFIENMLDFLKNTK